MLMFHCLRSVEQVLDLPSESLPDGGSATRQWFDQFKQRFDRLVRDGDAEGLRQLLEEHPHPIAPELFLYGIRAVIGVWRPRVFSVSIPDLSPGVLECLLDAGGAMSIARLDKIAMTF